MQETVIAAVQAHIGRANFVGRKPVVDQYGREIKKGIVFGYLCVGLGKGKDNFVYRFGKTTKFGVDLTLPKEDQTKVFIERLGAAFGGLNKPEIVILFELVKDVNKAWDQVQDYLRGRRNALAGKGCRNGVAIRQETSLGDNFYSCNRLTTEFEKILQEVFRKK